MSDVRSLVPATRYVIIAHGMHLWFHAIVLYKLNGPSRLNGPLVAARYAIIAHVVHLVNRDYMAMCYDYYT